MNTTILVFLLYFLALIALGWYGMRATRDEADYWIAGGRLGWALGGGTLASTHVSAGTFIGTIGVMYTAGWSFGWVLLTIPLAYWFVAAVLAPRFTRTRALTLPAFIETRYYSRWLRALAALIILIAITVYIQAQIVAGGLIGNIVFGLPTAWGMTLFTAILLAYTVTGGMFAVVYTDFLQLAIMVVGVLVAVPVALARVDGAGELFALVQSVNPRVFEWQGALPPTLLLTMGLAFFLGTVATPEKLVRLYAMKDMRTIRRGILFATVCITVLNLLVFILGLVAVVLFPALPRGDLSMPMIASAVLPAPIGALMLAAVTSAMMSTVDSLLLVAGSALSYDIVQTLAPNRDLTSEHARKRRVWLDRLGVLVVGTAPLLLLLSGVGARQLVQFIVLLFTAIMGASFFMPVVAGVLWRRATREGAAAAMVGGIVVTFVWKAAGPASIDPVLPGFLCSAVLLVVVSLLTPPPPANALEPYFGGEPQVDSSNSSRSGIFSPGNTSSPSSASVSRSSRAEPSV
jgi:SSS family transporter